MNRWKLFDRALIEKQIGGISLIVIINTIYLITGVFFGNMSFQVLFRFVLLVNMIVTCILYHSFIISMGDLKLELITEKIVYYPTTRFQFLLNKYIKTAKFILIQLFITILCLILGYYGSRGQIDNRDIIGTLMTVCISIMLTSGVTLLVMHRMPFGVYLPMLLYAPLAVCDTFFQKLLWEQINGRVNLLITIFVILTITTLIWFILLWIGTKIYEQVN